MNGWRNHAPQRFDRLGNPGAEFTTGKGLAKRQTELAGASEPTVPRRERRGCHHCIPRAKSLNLGR